MVLSGRRGTNLETQILEVRHMSRLKFFYLGYLVRFETNDFERVWPPLPIKVSDYN